MTLPSNAWFWQESNHSQYPCSLTRSLYKLRSLPFCRYLPWQVVGQCWCPGKENSVEAFTDAHGQELWHVWSCWGIPLLEREQQCPGFSLPEDRKLLSHTNLTLTLNHASLLTIVLCLKSSLGTVPSHVWSRFCSYGLGPLCCMVTGSASYYLL